MIANRHAVVDGVLRRTRGDLFGLCRSAGHKQVRFVPCIRPGGTTCRERQCRGVWQGELSLRLKAVLSVIRQLMTVPSSGNRKDSNEKATQSCSTQGVGITVHRIPEEGSPTSSGEALVNRGGSKSRAMVGRAPLGQWAPYRPLPLANFYHNETT